MSLRRRRRKGKEPARRWDVLVFGADTLLGRSVSEQLQCHTQLRWTAACVDVDLVRRWLGDVAEVEELPSDGDYAPLFACASVVIDCSPLEHVEIAELAASQGADFVGAVVSPATLARMDQEVGPVARDNGTLVLPSCDLLAVVADIGVVAHLDAFGDGDGRALRAQVSITRPAFCPVLWDELVDAYSRVWPRISYDAGLEVWTLLAPFSLTWATDRSRGYSGWTGRITQAIVVGSWWRAVFAALVGWFVFLVAWMPPLGSVARWARWRRGEPSYLDRADATLKVRIIDSAPRPRQHVVHVDTRREWYHGTTLCMVYAALQMALKRDGLRSQAGVHSMVSALGGAATLALADDFEVFPSSRP